MNLKDLSKEQKQYLIIGVLGVVVVIGAIVIGVKFSMSSIGDARVELKELTDKIDRADRSLANQQQNEKNFFNTIYELKDYFGEIPPEQNYYSWATEVIYGIARAAHLKIDSVNEAGSVKKNTSGKKNKVSVQTYSLRIVAHGGFEDVKYFLQEISSNYPLVRITGLEVRSGSLPAVHDVQLLIQWPFRLAHIADTWGTIPPQSQNIEAMVETREAPTSKQKKTPIPPEPRKPQDIKPVEQPSALTFQAERTVPPVEDLMAKQSPEVPQVVPVMEKVSTLEKQPETDVSLPEELQPSVDIPDDKAAEPRKSADRLEALLKR